MAPIYPAENNPKTNINVPHNPKKCMGLFPNFVRKEMVIKSKNPLIKRLIPNFVSPYFLAWCCTTFSPIFLNPSFWAKTGIYRCISPLTFTFFTTVFL